MNNGTQDAAPRAGRNGGAGEGDALAQTKRELMQAELKLARARATMTTAEIDVRVLTARLRTLAK